MVVFPISTHSTVTPGIPVSPTALQPARTRRRSTVKRLVPKDALFEPEQLAEIYRALAFVREQDEALSCGRDRELAELMEQVSGLLPTDALRQRDAPERGTMTMK